MTVHRIRYEGPATLALRVATELADADGVDLISSEPPEIVADDTVMLEVTAEGTADAVSAALGSIRDDLPSGASIAVADD